MIYNISPTPEHAIRTIANNLSGRKVGDSVTELGLRRIADPDYPTVIHARASTSAHCA
ncbi:PAS domain-containing protein [Rhodococcus sp. NPDC057529]|uniref:PAS domain-containing protein n=1 Tax=Rhodococcus sp. NPDC057529 TaxID=3346158 RepID=UPI00366D0E59